MKVNDYNEKTSQHVAFFTKDERFIGFRSGENAWGIAADFAIASNERLHCARRYIIF